MVPVKKVVRTGLYAGGGLAAVGAGVFGMLFAEARLAHATVNAVDLAPPPNATGFYGRDLPGPQITVALLGDSSAAGYGLEEMAETPGAVMATGLAERSGRRVHFHDLSVIGALSSDLEDQVDLALAHKADVAVILVGANDVVHMVRPSRSVRHLERAVRRLLDGGVPVLVGTCPDLGTIGPILPPLRQMARWWSRRIAVEQTVYVVRAGGRTVSLAAILGPEFTAHRDFFFGPDQFHPSAAGYAALAEVLLPSTMAALGLIGDEEAELETYRGDPVLPIAAAALRAVNIPGTELDPAPRPRGRLGRLWVKVAHRRRRSATAPAARGADEAVV
jgi:lysophospholipase L1-like esterase